MSAPKYTLAELLVPENLDAIRARFMSGLQGAGYPAITEWSPRDGVEMSFVDMYGSALADKVAAEIPAAVASGFLGKATDAYADLLAEKCYLTTRNPATKTTFNEDMVCASTAGPYSFEVGDVELLGASGKRYRNTTRGDVNAGASVTLAFEAVEPGAAYADDPAGMILVTSQAGISISPAAPVFSSVLQLGVSTGRIIPTKTVGVGPDPGTYTVRIDKAGDPGVALFSLDVDGAGFDGMGPLRASTSIGHNIVLAAFPGASSPASFLVGDTFTFTAPGGAAYVQGSDAESTPVLMSRCSGRWSTLSLNPTDGLFLLWAVLAYQAASRVQVSADLDVAGRTLLTIADSHGPLDAAGVAKVTAYIAPKLRCILDGVLVKAAAARSVTLAGFVLVDATTVAAVQEDAQARWTAFLASIPIGGTIKLSFVEDLLMDAGAIDVTGLQINEVDDNLGLLAGEAPVSAAALADPSMLTWIFA